MTQRTFIDKNGNEWTWEENAEVLEAVKQLHQQQQVPDTRSDNSLV